MLALAELFGIARQFPLVGIPLAAAVILHAVMFTSFVAAEHLPNDSARTVVFLVIVMLLLTPALLLTAATLVLVLALLIGGFPP